MSNADKGASASTANRRTAADFKHANHHSSFVRVLRKLLPAVAIVSSVSFIALAAVSYVPLGDLSVGGASLKDGRLIMETPKIAGFDAKGQPYEVQALRATQDLSTPDIIELEKIDADLPMNQENFAKLTADEGTYDSEAVKLQLRKNIQIRGARGMDVDLQSANIDIETGFMRSDEPVVVVSGTSTVSAQSVEVEDSGKRIVFRDNVSVVITKPIERGTGSAVQQNQQKDVSE